MLTRLCVNPMQDKVNNIRGMALESQEEFDAALGDGSKGRYCAQGIYQSAR